MPVNGRTNLYLSHVKKTRMATKQSTTETCAASSFAGLLALVFLAAGAESFSTTLWLDSSAWT